MTIRMKKDVRSLDQQLVWNRLLAIVEEQAQTLMRTAFSTVVREAGDLSAGVFDLAGQMLAQAVTGTPGHVNAMAASVGKFLKVHPLQSLCEGDVLLTNDPWDGTGHLNDFTVVTPIFHNGACVALFASTSHIADVGGRGFGPDANDLFEEGLQIPICPLFRQGHRDETLMHLIKANVRDPVTAEGDLHSLTACNDMGGRALKEMLDDFNLKGLDEVSRFIIDASRQAMAQEIAKLPDGEYRHEMTIDGYRDPVTLKAALRIDGERLSVDFSGSSRTTRSGGWWRGDVVMVMNAEFVGDWHVVARGHPNDGRAESCSWGSDFGVRQRWAARRRLPTGGHVPHPLIETRTFRERSWSFDAPMEVRLDGVRVGRTRRLDVTVDADAAVIYA